MYDALFHSIVKKHSGELSISSSNFTVADGVTTRVTITIPKGQIAYILEHGGYTNDSPVLANLINSAGRIIATWDEFPDTSFSLQHIPITQESHRDKFYIDFTNSSGSTVKVLIFFKTILIPEPKMTDFERDMLALSQNIIKITKK